MFRRFIKRRKLAAFSVVAVLAIAGAAIAYFTDSGSGTGNATVGTSGHFTVAQTGSTGTMYPGSGTSVLSFSITNNNSAEQSVSTVTNASVNADTNGYITENNGANSVAGCKASWFHIDAATVTPADLATGQSTTGSVTVSMPADSADNQDNCKNATPDINYTVG
jgi:hypothetical protein